MKKALAVITVALLITAAMIHPLTAQIAREDKVLFISDRETKDKPSIFVMKPDGSDQKKVNTGDLFALDPSWSPDGKWILCTNLWERTQPKSDVYRLNADGTQPLRLTDNPSGTVAMGPVWSRDGKRIAFSTSRIEGNGFPQMTIHVMDADGKNKKDIGEGMLPAWSPDGNKILFTSFKSKGDFDPRLSIMDADGNNAQQLAGDEKSMAGVWSPDGKQITFMAEGVGGQPDIFVMDADGSNKKAITSTTDEIEIGPAWSADGKRVYFTQFSKGGEPSKSAVIVAATDGSSSSTLTINESFNVSGCGGFFFIMRLREGAG